METMLKKLTITNRELVREWPRLREKLRYGEVDQLIVRENGYRYIITYQKPQRRPGDISELLERLKKGGPKKRISKVKLVWRFKSLPHLFQE